MAASQLAAPRVCVLRAPGTNCDVETAHAFDMCGGRSDRVHLFRLVEQPELLDQYQVLCIPGGFSYGDDIGSGVVFASQLRGHLGDAIQRFLAADKLVLGICNGFQTLLKSGILPHGVDGWSKAGQDDANSTLADSTLTWNLNGKYTARWVHCRVTSTNNVFLRGIDSIDLPIAHAEGRIVVRDNSVIDQWRSQNQVALEYTEWPTTNQDSTVGSTTAHPANERYAANPNGSTANIAGLSDPTGRVFGLMPHPERFLFGTQHPHWTRLGLTGDGLGRKMFQNAIDYFA